MEVNTDRLAIWFEEEKRDFPWRKEPTPYRVWVSEVMLQQTRASVVIPYFERWMERFPSVHSLAAAEEAEVIKCWEGLGYYSRARSLHQGAKYLVTRHGGTLPRDPVALEKVKGIGSYTLGAILSFAFQMKAAAVDGNVLRVVARLFAIEEEIDNPRVVKEVQKKVLELLPDIKPWVIMEAMIELGARICDRSPKCLLCPLQDDCLAFAKGMTAELPKRKKRVAVTELKRVVPVLIFENQLLVKKQEKGQVMADLFEFPYFETNKAWTDFYPKQLKKWKELSPVKHTFTRYRATLFPTIWKVFEKCEVEGFIWVEKERLKDLPFSSGHKKILKEAYAHFTH